MLDLRQIADDFIRTKLNSMESDNVHDEKVILAVESRDKNRADREKELLRWLNFYKVLLFFPPDRSREIASKIIEFADQRRTSPLDKDMVVSEYNKLEQQILQVAPRNQKSVRHAM